MQKYKKETCTPNKKVLEKLTFPIEEYQKLNISMLFEYKTASRSSMFVSKGK